MQARGVKLLSVIFAKHSHLSPNSYLTGPLETNLVILEILFAACPCHSAPQAFGQSWLCHTTSFFTKLIINKPGVGGAVLRTPLLLIN